jgi:hypothetical protein
MRRFKLNKIIEMMIAGVNNDSLAGRDGSDEGGSAERFAKDAASV